MRPPRLAAVLVSLLAACAPAGDAAVAAADSTAAPPPSFTATTSAFVPVADPSDPAAAALVHFLDASREGSEAPSDAADALVGCDALEGVFRPNELLADFALAERATRGDTVVLRARVVTVADLGGAQPDAARPLATVRVRRGEWEWELVPDADSRWRVCAGPRFGFADDAAVAGWRPAGASHATARALADSVRAAAAGS